MAIKISGTTVIDDSRNIDNIQTLNVTGDAQVGAALTAAGGIGLSKLLKEEVNIVADRLSTVPNIDLENGMIHYFTTLENQTATPNIRYNASTSLDSKMSVGEAISVTIMIIAYDPALPSYYAELTIDGSAVTENWIGGSAPSDNGSYHGPDIYSYTIIKTASATFTVIANQSKTTL